MQGAFINLLRGAALAQGSFLIALATIAPDVDWSGDTNDGPVVATKSSTASTGSTKTPAETGWADTTKTTTAPTSAPAGDVGAGRARSPWGWVVAAGSVSMAAAFVTAAAVVSRRFVHTLSVVSSAAAPRGAGGVGGAAASAAAKSVTTEPIVKVVT